MVMVRVTKKLITMSFFKIISHPYTLLTTYFILLISGEHMGGFYLLYVLLALPYGGLHSILAVAGGLIIFINYHTLRHKHLTLSKVVNILGLCLLFFSIYYFFWNDPKGYNLGTFRQAVPLASFIITGIFALCFLINNLPIKINSNRNHKSSLLSA
jgi:hypothetical protein